MKSKIHNAVVTDAKLDYVGSISIDEKLIAAAGLNEGEKVLVVNNNNGERIETYVIWTPIPGTICLNGAAARRFQPGDTIIIIAFGILKENSQEHKEFIPKIVFPYDENKQFLTLEQKIGSIYDQEARKTQGFVDILRSIFLSTGASEETILKTLNKIKHGS